MLQAVDEVADWQPERCARARAGYAWVTYLPGTAETPRAAGARRPGCARTRSWADRPREPRERARRSRTRRWRHSPPAHRPPDVRGACHGTGSRSGRTTARSSAVRAAAARGSRTSRPSRHRNPTSHVGGFPAGLAHQLRSCSGGIRCRPSRRRPTGPARARAAAAAWRAGYARIARSTSAHHILRPPRPTVRTADLARGTRRSARLLAATGSVQLQTLQPLRFAARAAGTCARRWPITKRWPGATATSGRAPSGARPVPSTSCSKPRVMRSSRFAPGRRGRSLIAELEGLAQTAEETTC